MSRSGQDLALYVMTRTHLQKARNIARKPHASGSLPQEWDAIVAAMLNQGSTAG